MESTALDALMAQGNSKLLEPDERARSSRPSGITLRLMPWMPRTRIRFEFSRSRKTTQTMDACLVKFGSHRRKAESRMQPGGTFPRAPAAALCSQYASLSRPEKSLNSTSTHGHFGMAGMAQQVHRLSGQMVSAVCG